jgi:hypothetical protein
MKRLTAKSIFLLVFFGALLLATSSASAGDLVGQQTLRRNQDVGFARKSTANSRRMNPLPRNVKVTQNPFTNQYLDYVAQQQKYEIKLQKWEYKKTKMEAKAVAKERERKAREEKKALADYRREQKRQEKLASKGTTNKKWSFGSKKTVAPAATATDPNLKWAPGQDPNDPNAAAQRAQLGTTPAKQGGQKPPSIWERLKVALFGKQS